MHSCAHTAYLFHHSIHLFIVLYAEVVEPHDVGHEVKDVWNKVGGDDMLAGLRGFEGVGARGIGGGDDWTQRDVRN